GQVTVLSLTRVTALLRGPQYATIRTSSSLHSPLHVAAWQLERMTRSALSLVPAAAPDGPGGPCAPCGPGGPGGPGGPASPFSPGDPAAPGSPFGPCPQPATQMESAIATTILFTCMQHTSAARPLSDRALGERAGFSFWLNVKRKPRACRGFQELTMKGILESRCPRRSDTIPRHKSGKARIATGCLRHAPGALYSYQRCVELPPLPD